MDEISFECINLEPDDSVDGTTSTNPKFLPPRLPACRSIHQSIPSRVARMAYRTCAARIWMHFDAFCCESVPSVDCTCSMRCAACARHRSAIPTPRCPPLVWNGLRLEVFVFARKVLGVHATSEKKTRKPANTNTRKKKGQDARRDCGLKNLISTKK